MCAGSNCWQTPAAITKIFDRNNVYLYQSILYLSADCEIRSVIYFLSAKGVKTAEIHTENCEVYEETIMNDGIIFKDFRTNVHEEEQRVVTEDLVQQVDETVK